MPETNNSEKVRSLIKAAMYEGLSQRLPEYFRLPDELPLGQAEQPHVLMRFDGLRLEGKDDALFVIYLSGEVEIWVERILLTPGEKSPLQGSIKLGGFKNAELVVRP